MFNPFNRCPQIIGRPYPLWGEGHFVPVEYRQDPMHVLWRPSDSPSQAGMLLVHGMSEYIGRYRHVAEHFAGRFHVVGVDLHAHGLTNPVLRQADRAIRRGAQTYAAAAAFLAQAPLRTLDLMQADFSAALAFLRQRCHGPVFVLAHSLGGLVAASALLESNSGVAGVVLPGPAFSVSRLPGRRGLLANPLIDTSFRLSEKCICRQQSQACVATLLLEGLMAGLSLPGMRWLFSPCRPDWILDYLTDWEEERERLNDDCYMVPRVLLSYVHGIEQEIIRFRRRMSDFRLPYFLIYSEEDPITAAWGNRDFASQTSGNHPLNRILTIPGPYHEQLFMKPPMPQKVLHEVDLWLDEALSVKAKA